MVTVAELETLFPEDKGKILWANPAIQICPDPGCFFPAQDQDELDEHRFKVHQSGTLDGREISKEDKAIAYLATTPNDERCCIYCLTKQKLRAMRIFNSEWKLLKTVRCIECKKEMKIDSTTKYRRPYDFGVFLAEYRGFWYRVNHDEWMKALARLYPNSQLRSQFWDGYQSVKPLVKLDKDGYRTNPS